MANVHGLKRPGQNLAQPAENDLNRGWMKAACGLGVLMATASLVACGGASAPSGAGAQKAEPPVLSLGREDVWVAGRNGSAATGPVLTGAIQAERRADLRAEVGSVVLRVQRDNGERVQRGELLVKLDDAAIRDTLLSAEEALRTAERSLEGAERTFQRLKSLQAQGMSSVQAMEDSEVRRNLAQSEQVAAKARVATARQQLERTEVRAPFEGVVASRKVSAGDTATMGKELVQVIDPASLRMEALVPAERVGELRVGQAVKVRVQGVDPAEREGRIRRIDSVAQPVSRQVAVVVDLVGTAGRGGLIAGLYAEGSVDVQAPQVLALPETALVRTGDQVAVWQLQGGTLKRQPVKLEPRDVRTGLFVVTQGLKAGDQVLRSPGSRPVEGQRYTVREG